VKLLRVLISDSSHITVVLHKIYSSFSDILGQDLIDLCRGFEIEEALTCDHRLIVLICPSDKELSYALAFSASYRDAKIIVIGKACDQITQKLGLQPAEVSESNSFTLPKANSLGSESLAQVCYLTEVSDFYPITLNRPALRYDYSDEWNNWGFGHIQPRPHLGCLSSWVTCSRNSEIIFGVNIDQILVPLVSFVSFDFSDILWINRDIGISDLPEWSFVEFYISQSFYGYAFPVKAELPKDVRLASCRVDCDEDICSSAPLVSLYKNYSFPVSLAVTTSIMGRNEIDFLTKVYSSGCSILSHSHTHPFDMGRSYPKSYSELQLSKHLLEVSLAISVSGFVNPFHHLPSCAVRAAIDAGYTYVVGSLSTRHTYNVSLRAGTTPIEPLSPLLLHNQQFMLHGDIANRPSSFEQLKQVLDYRDRASSIISYLDHPFSKRYSYGWNSETDRLRYHEELIKALVDRDYRFVSLDMLATYLDCRRKLRISELNLLALDQKPADVPSLLPKEFRPCLLYDGKYVSV